MSTIDGDAVASACGILIPPRPEERPLLGRVSKDGPKCRRPDSTAERGIRVVANSSLTAAIKDARNRGISRCVRWRARAGRGAARAASPASMSPYWTMAARPTKIGRRAALRSAPTMLSPNAWPWNTPAATSRTANTAFPTGRAAATPMPNVSTDSATTGSTAGRSNRPTCRNTPHSEASTNAARSSGARGLPTASSGRRHQEGEMIPPISGCPSPDRSPSTTRLGACRP